MQGVAERPRGGVGHPEAGGGVGNHADIGYLAAAGGGSGLIGRGLFKQAGAESGADVAGGVDPERFASI